MKKAVLLVVMFSLLTINNSARVIKVDINGSGQFTSISAAITASVAGDTIKVLPGIYNGAFTISKDIVIVGSGYESTKIYSNNDPTITMNGGKIMWVSISSTSGNGVNGVAGIITNCVISSCSKIGIYLLEESSVVIMNCVVFGNGSHGIYFNNPVGYINNSTVQNTISLNNSNYGFAAYCFNCGNAKVSYSCGSFGNGISGVGNSTTDPRFISSIDYQISISSPCWDKGNSVILDPDGSPSDMGYFGGPDCPVYPVVKNVRIIPQTDSSIIIEATGVANY